MTDPRAIRDALLLGVPAAPPSPLMSLALAEAIEALGRTWPNPAVGAVVARNGVILGRGHTQPPGGPHAEMEALRQAGDAAQGAELYVSLEPHAHHGRTPPCTDAIIAAGIARVVFAVHDPNPDVHGAGETALRAAGLAVESGDGAGAAGRLLRGYRQRLATGLPWVSLKWAMSLDGKLASRSGDSRWISGEDSRAVVHELRATADAVLAGAATVLHDDPLLTARPTPPRDGHQPLRVILDGAARVPPTARVFREPGATLVAIGRGHDDRRRQLEAAGAEVLVCEASDGHVDPAEVVAELGRRGVTSVFAEGGGRLHGALLDAGLAGSVYTFIAPLLIGGGTAPAIGGIGALAMDAARRLEAIQRFDLGADLLISGDVPAGRWLPSLVPGGTL